MVTVQTPSPAPTDVPCAHRQPEADRHEGGLARTGHAVGRVYFSAEHTMHYLVVASTTQWQLAPDDAVALLWENGSRTVTTKRRGADPECLTFPVVSR